MAKPSAPMGVKAKEERPKQKEKTALSRNSTDRPSRARSEATGISVHSAV